MALFSWTGPRSVEAELGQPHDAALAPTSGSQSGLRPESISSLAAQWREAHAIAEAQEQRLEMVESAAASLYPGARPGEHGEIWHELQRDRDGWWRQAETIDASLGLPALRATADCAWKMVEQLSNQLLALQPADAREAAMKFGILMTVLRADAHDIDPPDGLRAFMQDLEHLAAAEARPH